MKELKLRQSHRGDHGGRLNRRWATQALRELGIAFRVVKGQGFFEANKDTLHDLRRKMLIAFRERKIILHPDNGGDEEAFKKLSEAVGRALKAFHWRIGEIVPEKDTGVLTLPSAIVKRWPQAFIVARRLQEGETFHQLRREGLVTNDRMLRKIESCLPPSKCACNRPARHQGSCHERLAKFPKWQEEVKKRKGRKRSQKFKDNLSMKLKGKLKTFEHREKLRQALTGKKLPPETKEKLRQIALKAPKGEDGRFLPRKAA